MLYKSYEVGADTGEAFSHKAQEAGFVLLGQIEVTVGEQTQMLTAGDGYYFESQIPHRFRYVGNSKE